MAIVGATVTATAKMRGVSRKATAAAKAEAKGKGRFLRFAAE